ncbi:hypothetical protein RHMOL_Rhmol13G0124400 [Rhododendron molle]|uniref:Uncharacterized protein n=1 Tax=Rhododendron molle TaxID=49168 RepID=A0ACC0L7B8_RHOML|nr:hypothetical protein RHMOL_Rhmol13G0124400 [Rhododendron molle]
METVVEMLQKSLDHLLPFSTTDDSNVPKDVKQGYFAVIAEDDYELEKFVIPLTYLTHLPSFKRPYIGASSRSVGFLRRGCTHTPLFSKRT